MYAARDVFIRNDDNNNNIMFMMVYYCGVRVCPVDMRGRIREETEMGNSETYPRILYAEVEWGHHRRPQFWRTRSE